MVIFLKTPAFIYIKKSGCPKCKSYANGVLKKSNTHDFTEKSIIVHGAAYDYSLVEYTNTDIKVKIICPKHEAFKQKPTKHLQNQGCPVCRESK